MFETLVPKLLLPAPALVADAVADDLPTAIRLLLAGLQWSLESSMTGLENVSAENSDSGVNIARCEQALVVVTDQVT